MNYLLEIRDKALEEINESYEYYEEQQIGLGDYFTSDVYKTIRYIQKFPLHFNKFIKNYRQAKTDKFPFLVVYEIEEENEVIIIISIFHTSRNPKKKLKE